MACDIGVEGYWIDKIEKHFAEMSPRMLSMLNGYKSLSFNYVIEEKGITVNNLHWTEMGNGAMRLEAELNGTPFRATFARKSKEYPIIMENGGIKMPFEKQKEYVERLFIPRITNRK